MSPAAATPPFIGCGDGGGGGGGGDLRYVGPGPWVYNFDGSCTIAAEVGAKLSGGLYPATQADVDALLKCMKTPLSNLTDPTYGIPCFAGYGFLETPFCNEALTAVEELCGGPSVTMTEM